VGEVRLDRRFRDEELLPDPPGGKARERTAKHLTLAGWHACEIDIASGLLSDCGGCTVGAVGYDLAASI
jgi:hypothetical protein